MRSLLRILALLLSLALVAAACSEDDPIEDSTSDTSSESADDVADGDESPGTIVDVAVAAGSFETLVAAVTAADLVETLSSEGPFTVFAPTDDAFAAALDALGITAEDLLADTETLTAILTYHVVAGEVDAATAISLAGQSAATVNGAEIAVSVVDGSVKINDATVTAPDVMASNGIIHVIDSVLLPPAS